MSSHAFTPATVPPAGSREEAERIGNDLATDSARTSSPRDMFFAFAGVNLAVTNLATGALGIVLGLSLVDVLLVYLIAGAAGAMAIGLCVIQAKRTGASVMDNARPAFGYQGTRVLTAVFFVLTACWFGVNSFFGVTAARSLVSGLGGPQGRGLDLLLLGVILGALVLIAIVGYRGILRYEKITVVGMGLAVVAVAIGAVSKGVDWSHEGTVSGGDKVTAIIVLVAALGIGWAVSWAPYTHDFGRHLRADSSEAAAFGWAWAGMFLGSFITFGLSAIIACGAESSFDVGRTVEAVLPHGVSIIVLLVMTIGLLPANLANLLVGPALLRTMNIEVSRARAVLATALAGLPIAVVGIFQPSFGTIFKSWMLTLVIVVTPWLVITLIDFFVLHRGHYGVQDLTSRSHGAGGEFFWPGITAWLVGVVAAMSCASTPLFTSPLMSHYFNGTDLSIFAGAAVAAGIYYPWGKRAKKVIPRVQDEAAREPASL
jgi:nucleobase:cation symporter-1, NCS1 family